MVVVPTGAKKGDIQAASRAAGLVAMWAEPMEVGQGM